jgi:hypothetical protein
VALGCHASNVGGYGHSEVEQRGLSRLLRSVACCLSRDVSSLSLPGVFGSKNDSISLQLMHCTGRRFETIECDPESLRVEIFLDSERFWVCVKQRFRDQPFGPSSSMWRFKCVQVDSPCVPSCHSIIRGVAFRDFERIHGRCRVVKGVKSYLIYTK